MGRDYVLELPPPTGLLFIPSIKHGKPLWNFVDRRKLLIHPPELCVNPTSRVM
jgi:hypothetical protein